MTRADVIRLAQEAGFRAPAPADGCMGVAFDRRDGSDTGASLEHFADLVAAAERNACARVCADARDKSNNHLFRSAMVIAEGEILRRGKPEPTMAPSSTPPPPRFVVETFSQAIARVPALERFDGVRTSHCLADVMSLADTMPGYNLTQVLNGTDTLLVYRLEAAPCQ